MTKRKNPEDLLKTGRPTIYSLELAKRICFLVGTDVDNSVTALCKKHDDLPDEDTIRMWRWEKPEFSGMYAQAKMFQAELMAERLTKTSEVEIYKDKEGVARSDSGRVAAQRLIVDTIKWQAAKLAPKIYGDAASIYNAQHENEVLKAELKELREQLDAQKKSEY